MIVPPTCRGFLFVRHGESTDNARKVRSGGDTNPPLTEQGRAQATAVARQLAECLQERLVDVHLIVSPLLRTTETAHIIASHLGIESRPIQFHEGFRERRLGQWNGLPADENSQRLIRSGATPPGGEAEADFRRRVLEAAHAVAAMAGRSCLPLVVSSRGVGRILGWSEMPNAAVFVWEEFGRSTVAAGRELHRPR